MSAALALLASLLWGVADFGGGLLTRGRRALRVVAGTQTAALLALGPAVAVAGVPPAGGDLFWGALAGLLGPVALICYYRALSIGPMGLVAPVAATGGVVPAVVGLIGGDPLRPAVLGGIVLALVGTAVAASAGSEPAGSGPGAGSGAGSAGSGAGSPLRALGLALVAGLGFGAVFPLLARGGHTSVLGTLLAQRGVSVLLLVSTLLATRRRNGVGGAAGPRPFRRLGWLALVAVGGTDLSANVAFVFASRHSSLAVTGVLSSLYPVATAVLAATALHERLTRRQLAGAGAAFAGVLLLAL